MKSNITPSAKYFASLTLQTRRYGHTYVHVAARDAAGEYEGISFSISPFGRSLQSGGHKYKVHAQRNGKPVPSKELKSL